MLYFMYKMARIKIEDIVFWILIFATIFVMLWKLFGSPSDMAAIITIGTFIISSGIMLWKNFFKLDKKTSLGFLKVKHDMEKNHLAITNRLNLMENNINNKLDKILK